MHGIAMSLNSMLYCYCSTLSCCTYSKREYASSCACTRCVCCALHITTTSCSTSSCRWVMHSIIPLSPHGE